MKSYANFILLENLLYNISSSGSNVKALSETLFNPRVTVVEENCSPGIGTKVPAGTALKLSWLSPVNTQLKMHQFLLKLDGTQLTEAELTALINQGKTEVMVRHTGSCNSTGGVCRMCLYASVLQSTANFVDSGGNIIKTYYDPLLPSMASLGIPQVGETTTIYAGIGRVKAFFQPSERAYFAWLSGTYSGAMFGINAFDTFPLPVKPSLGRAIINKNTLAGAIGELTRLKEMPSNYIDYLDSLDDDLEKAVAAVVLYTVYGGGVIGGLPVTFPRARDVLITV